MFRCVITFTVKHSIQVITRLAMLKTCLTGVGAWRPAERHFLSHILYKGTARSFLNADYITSAMAGWFHWATYQVNCLESEACALRYRLTGRSIRSFLMRQSSFLWHNRCWKRCVYWLGSSTFERYQWKAVSEPEQWWHYMHSQNRSIYENENLVNHC